MANLKVKKPVATTTAQPKEKAITKSTKKDIKTEALKEIGATKESTEKYMTQEEEEALKPGAEEIIEEKTRVSTEKMEKAVELVQDIFNLSDKGYVVNSFSDAVTKIKLSLANGDFEISVVIKDTEKHGLL
jgi:hypothetical protein